MFSLPWLDYPSGLAFAKRALRRLSAPADRVLRWRRRNQALEELRGLDSRTLQDMGMHEGEIWWVADAYSRGVEYRREEHDRTHRVRPDGSRRRSRVPGRPNAR